MATRKWVADDGTQFDSKAEVDAYEERTPHINIIAKMVGDDRALAEKIFKHMEGNFRVPKPRKAKTPKTPKTTTAGATSGAATPPASTTAAAYNAGKKK